MYMSTFSNNAPQGRDNQQSPTINGATQPFAMPMFREWVPRRIQPWIYVVTDVTYKGRVLSLSDATGSAFSLIPIDNATGNFVKVEQRLTIRIALDETDPSSPYYNSPEDLSLLKAGYSVECEVKY